MASKRKSDLADKVRRCLHAKALGLKNYHRADALLEELAREMEPGQVVELDSTGKKAILVDQFAAKTIVWKPCGVRRWDLEVSP